MKNLLPVHLLKLRWLLSQYEKLSIGQRVRVSNFLQHFEAENYKSIFPHILESFEELYTTVRLQQGEEHVG